MAAVGNATGYHGPLRVGDTVSVPGDMHGTLKFIGFVSGKSGTFAGVQLASEYAARGKNSGDVDGKYYFRTSVQGSGIFLPVDRAMKRASAGSTGSGSGAGHTSGLGSSARSNGGFRATNGTKSPGNLSVGGSSNFNNHGGRNASTMQKSSFSQSLGPASMQTRATSPALKSPSKRESLPRHPSPVRTNSSTTSALRPSRKSTANAGVVVRPSSPQRRTNGGTGSRTQTPMAAKLQTPRTRPSIGLAKSTMNSTGAPGSKMKSPGLRAPSLAPNSTTSGGRFAQSLRQSQVGRGAGSRRPTGSSIAAVSSPLGPDDRFDEERTSRYPVPESETTPTPAGGRNVDMTSDPDVGYYSAEAQRLRDQLDERDRQLADQASSIIEMERSLADLQKLLPLDEDIFPGRARSSNDGEERLPRDVQTLRTTLREKNEKIKAMTAEFDRNRADFRSTIDTLELASTETERVYEQRVDELIEQVRNLQDRNEDFEGVAQQFRQLEEMVQELEGDLEESRRGEAEARGEVEFLRGEVERGQSELRRERERNAAKEMLEGSNRGDGGGSDVQSKSEGESGNDLSAEDWEELNASLTQKDDEIRGLKAIIQGLQEVANHDSPRRMSSRPNTNGANTTLGHDKTRSTNTVVSIRDGSSIDTGLQQQIRDLEALLEQKSSREGELQDEVRELRKSVQFGEWPAPPTGSSSSGPGVQHSMHRRIDSEALTEKHRSAGSQHTLVGSNSTRQHGQPNTLGGGQNRHSNNKIDELHDETKTDGLSRAVSVSEATDNSSGMAPQWCELCEESGHDILNCGNMIGPSKSTLKPRSPNKKTSTGFLSITDDDKSPSSFSLRDANTSTGLGINGGGEDIDRPAPLRQVSNNTTLTSPVRPTSSNLTSGFDSTVPPRPPPSDPLPAPPTMSSLLSSSGSHPVASQLSSSVRPSNTPATSATSNLTSAPTTTTMTGGQTAAKKTEPETRPALLIEGTGDQVGMLAGKSTGVIDPDKWCALCERDGHDSVDCPIEDSF